MAEEHKFFRTAITILYSYPWALGKVLQIQLLLFLFEEVAAEDRFGGVGFLSERSMPHSMHT